MVTGRTAGGTHGVGVIEAKDDGGIEFKTCSFSFPIHQPEFRTDRPCRGKTLLFSKLLIMEIFPLVRPCQQMGEMQRSPTPVFTTQPSIMAWANSVGTMGESGTAVMVTAQVPENSV